MAGDRSAGVSGWRSVANRSIGGSLFASGASQLFLIVSGVLVARGLGPEDRGHLALLVVVATVCAHLGTMGLPLAATYYIAHDRSHARQIASSLLRTGVVLGVATLTLAAAVLTALVVDEPGRVKAAAVISLLLVSGIFAFAFGIAILQGQQRFTAFNILRILPTAAYVVGVAVVFMVHSADLVHVMTIWATAYFLGGFLALGVAVRGLPTTEASGPAPSRSRMTTFGLKSLLGSLSPVEALRLDQVVVGLFLAPAALGLYVVAQAFTNLPRIVAASIGMVGYPQVASEPDRAAARRAMWKFFLLGSALSALAVGALEVLAGELVTLFFGSEFGDATSIARILLLGTFFVAARRVLTDGVNGLGQPGLGTLAEVASWVILIPSLAILVPRFGVDGVAAALAFSWAASLLLLIALVAMGDTLQASAPRLAQTVARRMAARPALLTRHQMIGLAVAVVAVSAGGIAVALLPPYAALIAIAILSAALLFAFGRATLGQKTRLLRSRLLRMALASPQALRRAAPVASTVGASVLAGLAVAVLPPRAALLVVLALAAALLFAFGRTVLPRATAHVHAGAAAIPLSRLAALGPRNLSTTEPDFRLARLLYYLGLLSVSLLIFRPLGVGTLSDGLFLAALLAAGAELVVLRRRVPIAVPSLLLLGITLFSLGGLISSFESYEAFESVAVIVRLVFLTLFWFWLGTMVLNRREHITTAVTLWVVSAGLCGAAAVAQLLLGDVIPGTDLVWDRSTGLTTHPNELGGLASVALIPAIMLAGRAGSGNAHRILAYVAVLFLGAGLILSGSVGSLLAALVGTFVWCCFQRNTVHSILVFATIGLSALALITAQTIRGAPTPLERISQVTGTEGNPNSPESNTLASRFSIYRGALREIGEHPFVGVGLDLVSITKPFRTVSHEFDELHEFDVHNVVIGIWYKAGLLGLAGLMIALLTIFRTGWAAIIRSRSQNDRMMAVSLFSSVIAFFVFAQSEPIIFSRYGWLSAALLLAFRAVQQRESHFEPEPRFERKPRLVTSNA